MQCVIIFNAFGDRRRYDRCVSDSKITYDYTAPVQNIGISLIWRFSGGKRMNVNAIENGSQNFKEVKDIR